MLINILLASLIPFLLWIIQKITKRTSLHASYIRRRIFAWGLLVFSILGVFDILILLAELEAESVHPRIFISLGKGIIFQGIVLFYGFKSGKKENEARGWWFSIWESYKPEYMPILTSKKD
tara:strand:+ start:105 stop:467 length:363 start_codon:yes stop_codon:yes gene_type:complete